MENCQKCKDEIADFHAARRLKKKGMPDIWICEDCVAGHDKDSVEYLRRWIKKLQNRNSGLRWRLKRKSQQCLELAKWQPIQTAPKDGRALLLLSAADEFDAFDESVLRPPVVHIGYWNPKGNAWVDKAGRLGGECYALHDTGVWLSGGGWFQPNEVTHWREIPLAPERVERPPSYTAECGCVLDHRGRFTDECGHHRSIEIIEKKGLVLPNPRANVSQN